MTNRKILTLLIIMIIILAGCHFPGQPWVLVEITSHEDGQAVLLNEEVRIITSARSSQGIARVQLFVNGEAELEDEPPQGRPLEHIADQPWIPLTEGQAIISVLAVDRRGTVSEPFSITLNVVASLDDIETEPTPTPTIPPEELALTQTAQAGCTNSASFLEHVTIPINTQVSANTNFTKIWRVNNNGTCDWAGYQLVRTSGEVMGANSPQALPVVTAGSNADIVVNMVAPATPGTHTAVWRIQAGDSSLFGPELTVTIIVPDRPTDTPVPTATFTSTPTKPPPATPTMPPPATPTIPPPATPLPISVQQFIEEISISPNTTENRTVTCPAGSVVVSGGFSHQSGIRIWESMKDGNGWRVYGTNSQASARSLTITATCLFNSGGSSSQVSTKQNVTPNDFTRITATCPSGSLVTGAGWSIGNNTAVQVYHSNKLDNGWQMYVNNPSGDNPQVTLYAVCLSGVSGITTQEVNPDNVVPANNTANAQKLCPAGTFVTGGGFVLDKELTLFNTTKELNGWINYAANTTGSEKRFDTYAVCYKP
jgi:hypothetical protein